MNIQVFKVTFVESPIVDNRLSHENPTLILKTIHKNLKKGGK
jgi:hypothetical protein